MKQDSKLVLLIFLVLFISKSNLILNASIQEDEFILKLDSMNEYKEFVDRKGFNLIEVENKGNILLVSYKGVLSDEVKSSLMLDERIRYIEPNYRVSVPEGEVLLNTDNIVKFTNDPLWLTDPITGYGQWNMRIIGLVNAWEITNGSDSIIVSVIDTGLAFDNPEISAQYIHGGYNWVEDNENPYDDNGHGSWVAGIIASKSNNHVGVSGIANVKIMAEKVLDSNGGGTIWDLVLGIYHAADNNVDIINLSLGTNFYSQSLKDSVDYAHTKGCIMVAAAGNKNTDAAHYPAAFDKVIAVSATYGEPEDSFARYSNYGDWVDISAPGGFDTNLNYIPDDGEYWIISLSNLPKTYTYGTGTSAAVPHVSGAAALYLSAYPYSTYEDFWDSLKNSVDDKGLDGWDEYYGYGRINIEKLLLTSNVKSVGGEARYINNNLSIMPIFRSFIIFNAILILIMRYLFYYQPQFFNRLTKIELYKRMWIHIRGN